MNNFFEIIEHRRMIAFWEKYMVSLQIVSLNLEKNIQQILQLHVYMKQF